MRIASFWTWDIWVLLLLNLGAEIAVSVLAIRNGLLRRFLMLPLYAVACSLADITFLALGLFVRVDASANGLWYSHLYSEVWWSAQLVAGVLLLFFSLQILTVCLPAWDRVFVLLGIIVCSVLAVFYLRLIPSNMLRAIGISDAVSIGALAMVWVVRSDEWPAGMRFAVAGLVLGQLLQGVSTVAGEWNSTMLGITTYGIPLSAFIGMTFFYFAALKMKSGERSQAV